MAAQQASLAQQPLAWSEQEDAALALSALSPACREPKSESGGHESEEECFHCGGMSTTAGAQKGGIFYDVQLQPVIANREP
ncbi:MAG TPA: hypothetical protein VNM37_06890, partial [Candidatus Dormibacteraeota bacterium]|nr:hypothetical protein [Candidatus Dormibacteraeota bacterium]